MSRQLNVRQNVWCVYFSNSCVFLVILALIDEDFQHLMLSSQNWKQIHFLHHIEIIEIIEIMKYASFCVRPYDWHYRPDLGTRQICSVSPSPDICLLKWNMFGLVPFKKGMQPGKKASENEEQKPKKSKIRQSRWQNWKPRARPLIQENLYGGGSKITKGIP